MHQLLSEARAKEHCFLCPASNSWIYDSCKRWIPISILQPCKGLTYISSAGSWAQWQTICTAIPALTSMLEGCSWYWCLPLGRQCYILAGMRLRNPLPRERTSCISRHPAGLVSSPWCQQPPFHVFFHALTPRCPICPLIISTVPSLVVTPSYHYPHPRGSLCQLMLISPSHPCALCRSRPKQRNAVFGFQIYRTL